MLTEFGPVITINYQPTSSFIRMRRKLEILRKTKNSNRRPKKKREQQRKPSINAFNALNILPH